MKGHKIN